MSRAWCPLVLGLLTLSSVGCDRSATKQPIGSEPAASANTTASASPGPGLSSGMAEPQPSAAPAEPAFELAPAASSASRDERQKAVLAVLAGEAPVARLAVVATEPGETLNPNLRDALAPRRQGGRIRMLPAQVDGKLPPEVVTRVVRGRFAQLRACYDRRLAENPLLAGKVTLELDLDAEGRVTRAGDKGSDFPDRVTVNCFASALRNVTFPKAEGGTKATVPFVLELAK